VIDNFPDYVLEMVKAIKKPLKFSFNISAKEFESEDFISFFKGLIIKKNLIMFYTE